MSEQNDDIYGGVDSVEVREDIPMAEVGSYVFEIDKIKSFKTKRGIPCFQVYGRPLESAGTTATPVGTLVKTIATKGPFSHFEKELKTFGMAVLKAPQKEVTPARLRQLENTQAATGLRVKLEVVPSKNTNSKTGKPFTNNRWSAV